MRDKRGSPPAAAGPAASPVRPHARPNTIGPVKPTFPRGAAAALAAVLMWGAQFPVAKSAFAVLDPVQLSAFRYGVATLLLLAWMLAREGPGILATQGRFRPVTALGVIGMTGSPVLVFAGLQFTRPEHAAVIVALQPSMTALADWALRGRRPANFTVACIVVAFLGVVTVVTKGAFVLHAGGREILGDVMVLAGAACWVVYTMGTERLAGWPTLKITLLTLIAGSIGMFALAAGLVGAGVLTVPSAADLASIWPALAFLTLGGVLAAMVLWNWGNRIIGALDSMLLLNLIPVVTFVIRFAQGERFGAAEIAGVAMVVGALLANNLYLRRKSRAAQAAAAR
jgi:drug/metabolite transporter (DMT)-like permease